MRPRWFLSRGEGGPSVAPVLSPQLGGEAENLQVGPCFPKARSGCRVLGHPLFRVLSHIWQKLFATVLPGGMTVKTQLTLTLLTLTSTALAAQAVPAKTSPIKLSAATYSVTQVTENGKTTERLSDAAGKGALPGSLLQMSQKVQNVSTRNVQGLRLNMRVDPATTYQTSNCDAARTNTLFSIDRGKTFAAKPTKTVTVTENGKAVQRVVPASPSDYTNVRWELPELGAGQTVNCNLRVRVK